MGDEIIKVLNDLGQKFGIAIDWSAENVMPYIKDLGMRFITYRNCMAIVWIFISIIMFIVGIICTKKLIKYVKSDSYDDYEDSPGVIVSGVCIVCLLIAAPIVFFCNIHGIIQNICMPELTIIEYIKSVTENLNM
jgi:hypothetical protein